MDNEGLLIEPAKPHFYILGEYFYSIFMEKKFQKPWWQPALVVFAEVTGWIAVPIIVALYLGRYLDEENNSEPWFFLGLTGVAFIISCTGMVIVAGKYIRQIEKEARFKKTNQESLNKQKKDE